MSLSQANLAKSTECQCTAVLHPTALAKKSWHSAGALLFNLLIALFPKCPMCWAAYMSLFGSVGLAHTPYMGCLFYLLLGFLSVHLFFLLKCTSQRGYTPFLFCLSGSLAILYGRLFLADPQLLNLLGLSLVTISALWNLITNFYKERKRQAVVLDIFEFQGK